jgi:hypothetical protein
MDASERTRLIEQYVDRYAKRYVWGSDGVLREQDLHSDVFEEFNRLARQDAESCWLLILGVINVTNDEYTLANLAAGPLEHLINHHGDRFIDRIEMEGRANPKFREVLCGVWDSVPQPLRQRLDDVRNIKDDA